MFIKIYDNNPNLQQILKVVDVLRSGGMVILPTDTVYAFACNIFCSGAVERILKLKNKDVRKSELSMICYEIRQISEFAKMDDVTFKLIKKNLPGPFTLILNGSNKLPKIFKHKKTVGIRMPNHSITAQIVKELGNPIMVSSIFTDSEWNEYITDPELIYEQMGFQVDMVVDGGQGGTTPSTVVDCTGDHPVVIREGAGTLLE